jgi:hypothetical protein
VGQKTPIPRSRCLADLAESRKYQNLVSTELAEQALAALYERLRGSQAADDQRRGDLLRDDRGLVFLRGDGSVCPDYGSARLEGRPGETRLTLVPGQGVVAALLNDFSPETCVACIAATDVTEQGMLPTASDAALLLIDQDPSVIRRDAARFVALSVPRRWTVSRLRKGYRRRFPARPTPAGGGIGEEAVRRELATIHREIPEVLARDAPIREGGLYSALGLDAVLFGLVLSAAAVLYFRLTHS